MKAAFWTTRFRLDQASEPLITAGAADGARHLRRGEWMHRTLCRPRNLLLGGLLIALLVSGRPESLNAQIPGTSGSPLEVPAEGTLSLQMRTKKAISLVKNSNDKVLGVKTVLDDPKRVFLTGLKPGISHVDLTDEDGKMDSYDVTVRDVKVEEIKVKVPLVPPVPLVPLDVEALRKQLRLMFPTSNVRPVLVDDNTVVLEGTVNRIEDAAAVERLAAAATPPGGVKFISHLRVAGVQQVQLCVTVAQVSREDARRMGFNFLENTKNTFFGSTVGEVVREPLATGVAAPLSAVFPQGQILNGLPGTPNGAPTNLLFGIIHSNWAFLGYLQALRDENVVKSLEEPTLTTESGRPASFLVGGEQAIPVPSGLGTVGIERQRFGTTLNFLPIVLGNGKIHLEVEPEVSSLNAAFGTSIGGTVVPGLSITRVNTTVELEDGQTFVLGGLVQRNVTASTRKTPILGDLPFLNAAFSTKFYDETETELVIMVTPHLVDAQDCAQAPKILPGQETRRPDDFELFLEGILEAPRGPREVFQGKRYVPAFKSGPTAELFPCAGRDGAGGAGCATCGADAARTIPPASGAAPAHGSAAPIRTAAPAAPIPVPTATVPTEPLGPDISLPDELPPAATIPESNDPN
jgi:pilus assembly protein CpaC